MVNKPVFGALSLLVESKWWEGSGSGLLWVKELCVNLEDEEERKRFDHGVRDVVKRAEEVLCWRNLSKEELEGAKSVRVLEEAEVQKATSKV